MAATRQLIDRGRASPPGNVASSAPEASTAQGFAPSAWHTAPGDEQASAAPGDDGTALRVPGHGLASPPRRTGR